MSNLQPDKNLITRRFARSFATYSDNAVVQHKIAARLLNELTDSAGCDFGNILEIGCGSGVFTDLLAEKLNFDHIYLNDIVDQCCSVCDRIEKSSFIPGDIESSEVLAYLPGNLDIIVSNAVFQWLHDLAKTMNQLASHLAPGGLLAFSTFGPENLSEIRSILGVSLSYYSLSELMAIIEDKYEILYCHEKSYFMEFASPTEVLRHMKNTGVTAISAKSWTKSDLAHFSGEYTEKFSSSDGVILTYQPIVVIASLR